MEAFICSPVKPFPYEIYLSAIIYLSHSFYHFLKKTFNFGKGHPQTIVF